MENIINTIGIENAITALIASNILLLLIILINTIKTTTLNKRYKNFIKKIGNGKNIEEDLENYMYKVQKVEKQNGEIITAVQAMEKDITKCIQKVGLYRYNAFKDVGSDLSFTLALLDENDSGVVLNGIYSREMSNIYAKPIENGKSKYTISQEEQEAIKKAKESSEVYKIK